MYYAFWDQWKPKKDCKYMEIIPENKIFSTLDIARSLA